MIRIGCRAHDYGKHTPVQLAHIWKKKPCALATMFYSTRSPLTMIFRSRHGPIPCLWQAFSFCAWVCC